jgi:hypothetical protein
MADAVRGSPVLCTAQPRVLGRVHTGEASLEGDGCKDAAPPFLTNSANESATEHIVVNQSHACC